MKRFIGVVFAAFIYACLISGCTEKKFPDDVPVITDNDSETTVTEQENMAEIEEKNAYSAAYLDVVRDVEARYSDMECSYGLIDINGDETPELVAGYSACINLYTYADGKIYTLMDEWHFGAMGNSGYSYLPGKNVIQNINSDMAGDILYETYSMINAEYELETYYGASLSLRRWVDENGDYIPDEEEFSDEPRYFLGEEEISFEEYEEYRFGEGFSWIFGDKNYEEITAELIG